MVIANPETKGQCGDSHLGEVSSAELMFHVENLVVVFFPLIKIIN